MSTSSEKSAARERPPTVVLIDHSFLHRIGWAEHLSRAITGVNFVLVTDKSPSGKQGALETINVLDAAPSKRLSELQKHYGFSVYRALVAERAYFDYTTFDNSQCYSSVGLEEIDGLISSYASVL